MINTQVYQKCKYCNKYNIHTIYNWTKMCNLENNISRTFYHLQEINEMVI